jgi:hypothetical protein
MEGWTFSVDVKAAEPVDGGIVTSNDSAKPLRLITVLCTAPDGATTSVATVVSHVPANLPATTSFQRWRRLTLRFPDRELTVTAPLRNTPDAY